MNLENYKKIKKLLLKNEEYQKEIEWCENVQKTQKPSDFFIEYLWVVINSGMKNQIAQKIFGRIIDTILNGNIDNIGKVFRHTGKVKAIKYVRSHLAYIFEEYNKSQDKLSYLESLPYIGKITKYHLARNLGLEACKPDRHLVRIAKIYNTTPEKLCQKISSESGDRIGVVDVILWRAGNLGLL